jgi:DNA protecting protein DprA
MFSQLLVAITHVITQVTGRWLQVPKVLDSEVEFERFKTIISKCQVDGLSSLTADDWLFLLEGELSEERSRLPWLRGFVGAGQLDLRAVAQVASRHFCAVREYGASVIFINSDGYPERLRQIARPPLMLTVLGDSRILTLRHIAVIGSRKASYDSLRMSVDVGRSLASIDIGVVSGGAIGCDIAVHEGMLTSDQAQVRAIVVLAGGLCSFFPRCNSGSFNNILERGGAIISERLWYQGVRPKDFPARNRIVSGMSDVVAVMAAAKRSGSLITAHEALEQGRDVYVYLPADHQWDVRYDGSMNLIADGAVWFSEPTELIEQLYSGAEFFCSDWPLISDACQVRPTLGTFEREQL